MINAMMYGRYLLGNAIADRLGRDIIGDDADISFLLEEQKDVLRQAVDNARKAGRSFIKYEDYPPLADGTKFSDYYKGKRDEEEGFAKVAGRSLTDPVFQMATTLGVFNFKDLPNGGFEIPEDTYDFDRAKSGGANRPKEAKDIYAKSVYLGQDVGGKYGFRFTGKIHPEGASFQDIVNTESLAEYGSKFVEAAYNTADNAFTRLQEVTEKNVPLEFLSMIREGANRLAKKFPKAADFDVAEIDFPVPDAVPEFMKAMKAVKESDHWNVTPKFAELGVSFKIPFIDKLYGSFEDEEVDFSAARPELPVAILSNEKLEDVNKFVRSAFDSVKPKKNDELSFSQVFARERRKGSKTFMWRGDEYNTMYREEMDVKEA